jgi:hypothetical protein
MQCKHKKIRQKSTVKNLQKLFGARNPRICICSLEQQQTCKKIPETVYLNPACIAPVPLHHVSEAHPLPDAAFLILPPLRP